MPDGRSVDLIAEAESYLAAVELFRAEGCEPNWRLENPAARRRVASQSDAIPIEDLLRRTK